MSSCGTEPYRPRRSFSSPIISSLQVQPLSLTSRNAKSPGSGRTSPPGVPQAASRSKTATGSLFISISLKSKSEGEEYGDLIPELDSSNVFEERKLHRDLQIDRGPGSKRPVDAKGQQVAP